MRTMNLEKENLYRIFSIKQRGSVTTLLVTALIDVSIKSYSNDLNGNKIMRIFVF